MIRRMIGDAVAAVLFGCVLFGLAWAARALFGWYVPPATAAGYIATVSVLSAWAFFFGRRSRSA